TPPRKKIIHTAPPDLAQLALPYPLYSDRDLATRFTYLETSRGCPFGCEYCVSAIERGVRTFDPARVLPEFERLLARGLKRVKFVDRTFNLDADRGREILEFFYDRAAPDLQVHLEITPSCLTPAWRALLRRAPPGLLRLEVGVQTFSEETNARIGRQQTAAAAEDELRFLRQETTALIHADLIAGLPGQTLEMFGADFDRMIHLQPHELQVGILKRLRGTAIARHDTEWAVHWHPEPPYDLLENKLLDAATVAELKRFARFWELLGNRGRFEQTLPLLWSALPDSPFSKVWNLCAQLFPRFGKTHGIPLFELAYALSDHLINTLGRDRQLVTAALRADLARSGALHLPNWLGKP
ncbi:MAG: radical SAM protein, partial [Kiritimatiellaeota bacterium]|nr:radical SAM protein [Kiritimatiellota bacterium]